MSACLTLRECRESYQCAVKNVSSNAFDDFEFESAKGAKARKSNSGEKQREPLYDKIAERLQKEKMNGDGFKVPLTFAAKRKREEKRSADKPLTIEGFKVNVIAALSKMQCSKHKGTFSVAIDETGKQLIIHRTKPMPKPVEQSAAEEEN